MTTTDRKKRAALFGGAAVLAAACTVLIWVVLGREEPRPPAQSSAAAPSNLPAAAPREPLSLAETPLFLDAQALKTQVDHAAGAGAGAAARSHRAQAPEAEGPWDSLPATERWQLYFQESITAAEYARQLDFFGIELGVVGGTGAIDYASKLALPTPQTRQGPPGDERRMYLSWQRGSLEEADRQLLARAGIDVAGRVVVLFLPDAVVERLAELERAHAGRDPGTIRRTRFGIRDSANAYEWYVVDQVTLQ